MMKSLTLQLQSLNQELHRSPMNKICISCDDSFIVGMPRDIETEYFYLSDSVYNLIQNCFFVITKINIVHMYVECKNMYM